MKYLYSFECTGPAAILDDRRRLLAVNPELKDKPPAPPVDYSAYPDYPDDEPEETA